MWTQTLSQQVKPKTLNYHLFQKLKLIGKNEFIHLIYTLTHSITCWLKLLLTCDIELFLSFQDKW